MIHILCDSKRLCDYLFKTKLIFEIPWPSQQETRELNPPIKNNPPISYAIDTMLACLLTLE